MILENCKEFKFEASHILPKHKGKCSRLHGHSWVLRVYVKGELHNDTGFVMDYAEIKRSVQPIIDNLDHKHLGTWYDPIFNETMVEKHCVLGMPLDFYPSSENLILWIANELRSYSHTDLGFPWSRLELDETCTSRCILERTDYDNERTVRDGQRDMVKA